LTVLDDHTATATEWNQTLEATRRLSNVVAVPLVSGVSASSSTNYTDIGNLATQFVKYGDGNASDLGVLMTGSCFVNTAGAKVTLAVWFEDGGGTTLDVAVKTMTVASNHSTLGGILRVLFLNGGPQVIRGRFKVSAGTVTANGDDSFMMLLWEIPLT
jgi:hypothetical protein